MSCFEYQPNQLPGLQNTSSSSTETDKIASNWLPLCVGGTVTWYVREIEDIDNSSGGSSNLIKQYKQGATGAITLTPPTGTITEGYCPLPLVTSTNQISTHYLAEIGARNRPTGVKVLVVTNIPPSGIPAVTYFNATTGVPWTGNPVTQLGQLPDIDEVPLRETMCNNGTTFFRLLVTENNVPTGTFVDVTLTGTPYAPVGPVTAGACPLVATKVDRAAEVVIPTLTTTATTVTLPFTTARELHLQGTASALTRCIISYATTNQPTPQTQSFYLTGSFDLEIPEEKGVFTSITLRTASGTTGEVIVNLAN
jgi:hypothetical protein